MAPFCLTWLNSPNRNQQYHQEGEDHLHVGQGVHPERTEDDQLDHLHSCEEVHFPLRHTADVVGGRIGGLDGEEMIKMLPFLPILSIRNACHSQQTE